MQPRFMDTYLPDATYQSLKAKLAELIERPDQIAPGLDAESAVVEALGEIGGVWPVSILNDTLRDRNSVTITRHGRTYSGTYAVENDILTVTYEGKSLSARTGYSLGPHEMAEIMLGEMVEVEPA